VRVSGKWKVESGKWKVAGGEICEATGVVCAKKRTFAFSENGLLHAPKPKPKQAPMKTEN